MTWFCPIVARPMKNAFHLAPYIAGGVGLFLNIITVIVLLKQKGKEW